MKKQVLSLALALALCLGLSAPALADAHELYIFYANGESASVNGSSSGEGWSYDSDTNTLTLNGLNNAEIVANNLPQGCPTIVLASGSRNVIKRLSTDSLVDLESYEVTFKGTGELIIYDANAGQNGVFYGFNNRVKLLDGLTMTGGVKEGDSGQLTFQADVGEYYTTYICAAGSAPAKYIRIGGTSSTSAAPSLTGFADVSNNSPYAEAVKWAVSKNITKGLTSTSFGPGSPCTEKQILTFLYRAYVTEKTGGESEAVQAWAQGKGMDVMHLASPCSRAVAVVNMWKAAGCPEPSEAASFSDVPTNADYAKAVSWAVEKGITSGTSVTAFSPANPCTRGQIVTFLYRAMK